jgi:predicted metal-binding membrane protein
MPSRAPSASNTEASLVAPALLGIAAIAWLSLLAWHASPYARFLDHHAIENVNVGELALLLVFLAGWVLMIAAMMLPTSAAMLAMFGRAVTQRPDRRWLVALVVAGYLTTWTLVGDALLAGDFALHRLVDNWPWLRDHSWLIAAATLSTAGTFQFSVLKRRCLAVCRSPRTFLATRWHGRTALRDAFRLGIDHGVYCIGCCWALMLVLFALGAGSLTWMTIAGLTMAAEKNARWGARLSTPLGILLLAGAVMVALTGMAPNP